MKSGLTDVFPSATIEGEPVGSPTKKPKAAINDKAQQKKWANKRDEIRAKRAELAASTSAAGTSAAGTSAAGTSASGPAKEDDSDDEAAVLSDSPGGQSPARPSFSAKAKSTVNPELAAQQAFVEAIDDVMSMRFGKVAARIKNNMRKTKSKDK